MIDPTFVHAHAHVIEQLVQGKFQSSEKSDIIKSYVLPQSSSNSVRVVPVWNREFPENSVAVLPLHDVIFKQDQECGPYGTLTYMAWLNNALKSENVIAIVLDVDSPGGEATNIETFANAIAQSTKPIFTSFNGLNCSAAYFATASTKIFATESTDIVGSVGTMISFLDVIPALEKQGAKYHEIYADQSSMKNKIFHEALKGNYEPIKEKLLNPYAKSFIDYVKNYRTIKNENALKGETYMAEEAVQIGLIDGIQTIEKTIELAYQLGMQNKQKSSSSNSIHMKQEFPLIQNIIGENTIVVDEEKGSYLTVENLESIENRITDLTTQVNDVNNANVALIAANNAFIKSEKDINAKITALEAELVAIGNSTGITNSVNVQEDKIIVEENEVDMTSAQHPYYKSIKNKYGLEVTN